MKDHIVSGNGIDRLIDDFIGSVLFVPFCLYHFAHTILSNDILSIYLFVRTILSIPFCPYHFARYHFVLEPRKLIAWLFLQPVLHETSWSFLIRQLRLIHLTQRIMM